MPLNIRTYHELTEADRSGLPGQIAAQRRRVAARLAEVRRVVAVMSGKGGVGKSFGVLDADLNGPTIARLLAATGVRLTAHGDSVEPAIGADGVRCISMDHLLEDGRPLDFRGPQAESFVWRGALEAAALREFLADVAWGALELLLVDLPPGIQRFTDLAELVPEPPAVLTVTIPTPESREAVRRALRVAVEHGARPVGIVENMVGPEFPGDAADVLSREFGIPVLARVPFHPSDDLFASLAARL